MFKTDLFESRAIRVFALVSITCILSGCALIPNYGKASDLQIEKLTTPTAQVTSAYLWKYRTQLSLRGQVVARLVSKRPLRGHLDISINHPNTEDVTCLTTPNLSGARRIQKSWRARIRWPDRKSYSVDLDEMPPPGSVIKVWHHSSNQHTSCVDPQLTSQLHATYNVTVYDRVNRLKM